MPDYHLLSDEELAQELKNSNVAAFKAIYYRYYERLGQYILTQTNSMELAKDLTQQIFACLWENRKKRKIEKSLKAYLYRMAHNMIVNVYRKKARENFVSSEHPTISNSISTNHLDLQIDLESAINDLPKKLRDVLILSRFEGLKNDEIALVCQISIKTVESRIGKALKLLRRALSE